MKKKKKFEENFDADCCMTKSSDVEAPKELTRTYEERSALTRTRRIEQMCCGYLADPLETESEYNRAFYAAMREVLTALWRPVEGYELS